jgi:hypothetical protein
MLPLLAQLWQRCTHNLATLLPPLPLKNSQPRQNSEIIKNIYQYQKI